MTYSMNDPTQRFSNRVENYVRYRPHYPPDVIEALTRECGLTSDSRIADVGSGTGILTEMFLRNGNEVFAVEPNREMREAGEQILGSFPRFHSVAGRAEATTLGDASVRFVLAGQAFHWFDREKAREEFLRILEPDGWVMLVWNERETGPEPFLVEYEQLLHRYATDYAQVDHRRMDDAVLGAFFGADGFVFRAFGNRQEHDLAGLEGRLLSSSYVPDAGHPDHAPMLQALHKLFETYRVAGRVAVRYTTKMYYGRLRS
jgi:SAM-dependent methyltransferase